MSVKTISIEQIASPVLLTDSDLASMRVMNHTNGIGGGAAYRSFGCTSTDNSSSSARRLPKNKSYSFLMSSSASMRNNSHFTRCQLTNSSTDSMIDSSRASFVNHQPNNLATSETFSMSSSRRNFIKSRLS